MGRDHQGVAERLFLSGRNAEIVLEIFKNFSPFLRRSNWKEGITLSILVKNLGTSTIVCIFATRYASARVEPARAGRKSAGRGPGCGPKSHLLWESIVHFTRQKWGGDKKRSSERLWVRSTPNFIILSKFFVAGQSAGSGRAAGRGPYPRL